MASCGLIRRLPACLAVFGVLGAGLLPAEHVHARMENGRHTELIHRHVEPHHTHDVTASFDHDDERSIRWLDLSFIQPPSGAHVLPVAQLLDEDVWVRSTSEPLSSLLPDAPDSVHDPPGFSSHGLRAPPLPLV